jgi:hypothetical protein
VCIARRFAHFTHVTYPTAHFTHVTYTTAHFTHVTYTTVRTHAALLCESRAQIEELGRPALRVVSGSLQQLYFCFTSAVCRFTTSLPTQIEELGRPALRVVSGSLQQLYFCFTSAVLPLLYRLKLRSWVDPRCASFQVVSTQIAELAGGSALQVAACIKSVVRQ